MGNDSEHTWSAVLAKIETDSVLADFAQPLPRLVKGKADIEGTLAAVARQLSKSKRSATLQFTLREGRRNRQWCLTMSPEGCTVAPSAIKQPDLEVMTDAESWMAIASGEVAPLEAFAAGKLRLIGDVELARLLVRRARR
jgi:putative sterol carrier protein